MESSMAIRRSFVASALALVLLTPVAALGADPSVLEPLPLPGPYPVACSNVVQDFNRLAPGEDVQAYWEGLPRDDGTTRFLTDLLSDPANTPTVTVNAPNDGGLYGSYAGRSLPFVVLVCYPTTLANTRPDYPLPTGRMVPRMQRGAEAPLLPDTTSRYPLLLFSHGYGGSPLSNDYISALTVLASFGYVVAAPFHGDWQYNNVKLESLGDLFYLVTHLRDFLAMQALRPLALSATIDLLLAHPQWRDRIDASEIGAFGASMGGESVMLMAGAGLTTSIGQSWTQVTKDARLKAAVGYVPYFGQPGYPAFGRGQQGLDGVTLPFLAISGTSDTSAPIALTLEGVARLGGARELVALVGVKHGFDVASTNDIFTWTLTFLDAEVRGDATAREKLLRSTSVAGGGDDRVLVPYNRAPSSNHGGLWWNAPAGSESGWGVNIAHQGDVIVATWETYDPGGKAWWVTMAATKDAGNTYSGTIYETRGPAFNAAFDPARVTRTAIGSGTLAFDDAGNGTFAYTINGIAQAKAITLVTFAAPVPVCTFGSVSDPALATNYQGLWWNAPAGSESGWSLSLAHQGNTIVAGWFTYDTDGTPFWLSAALVNTTGATYAGTLFQTSGPAWSATPFDPRTVTRVPVGTAGLTFANGNAGTFSSTVNGVTQAKPITRFIFQSPGTVCQ
jgi:predicted dienelactone hydrolase